MGPIIGCPIYTHQPKYTQQVIVIHFCMHVHTNKHKIITIKEEEAINLRVRGKTQKELGRRDMGGARGRKGKSNTIILSLTMHKN